jgi:hypothetical protein
MLRQLGWVAAGGFGVGVVGLSLAVRLGADDLSGFAAWRHHWPFATSCRDDGAKIDPAATERHWAWDGGDTVDIAVPATIHYRGGSGGDVIARGSAARSHVFGSTMAGLLRPAAADLSGTISTSRFRAALSEPSRWPGRTS